MKIFIQIIGFVGCGLIALSSIQKSKGRMLLFMAFGGLIFCIHYLLLGAWAGALMNGVSILRAFAFGSFGGKRKNDRILIAVFVPAILLCYPLAFLFGTEPTLFHFLVELLPIAAMVLATFSFALPDAAKIRRISIIVSPMWLLYNIFHVSIGGIICESINLAALIYGIFVIDRRAKKQEAEAASAESAPEKAPERSE